MKGVLLPAVTSPCVFTGDHGSVCVHPTLHTVDPKIKKNQLKSRTSVRTLLLFRFHFEVAALLCAGLLVLFLPVAALVNGVCSSA